MNGLAFSSLAIARSSKCVGDQLDEAVGVHELVPHARGRGGAAHVLRREDERGDGLDREEAAVRLRLAGRAVRRRGAESPDFYQNTAFKHDFSATL